MFRNFLILSSVLFAVAVFALVAGPASAATIHYTFNGPSIQGWSELPSFPEPTQNTGGIYGYVTGVVGASLPSGDLYSLMPVAGAGPGGGLDAGRNNAHATTVFVSPTFVLDGTGDLSFYLAAARADTATLPSNLSGLPASSTSSASSGFIGGALLQVSTGNLVLSQSRTSAAEWQLVDWTSTQLAPYANNGLYRVALIDYLDSSPGNGWLAMGDITVPGYESSVPEPGTLALLAAGLAGLLCYAWRKRR